MPPVGPEGSADRPYRENPPEHLKEVHWGGAEFAAGVDVYVPSSAGDTTNVLFLRGASKSWTEAKILSGALSLYDNRAGGFGNPRGTPTFLLGGALTEFTEGGGSFRYVAWIEASTDRGRTWIRSYTANDGFVVAIVYDSAGAKFYAQSTAAIDYEGSGNYSWIVLESVDGLSWRTVETTPGGPFTDRYASPIMTAAAASTYQDGENNNCPGGVYGYDKAKKILMAPYPDISPFAYEARFSGSQVQIRTENQYGARAFDYIDIPGMDRVFSVAYSGGAWVAAGSGDTALIVTSTDDGRTWETTYTGFPSGSAAQIALGGVIQ